MISLHQVHSGWAQDTGAGRPAQRDCKGRAAQPARAGDLARQAISCCS